MHLPEVHPLWDYKDPVGSEKRFRESLPSTKSSGDDAYIVELLTQIARAACLRRQYDIAHAILDDAYKLLNDDLKRPRIRYLLERGRIFNDTGRTQQALRSFKEAWGLAEKIGDRVLGADALHMIAYVSEGEESLRWHHIAIDFCENSDGERFQRWLVTLYMNAADKYEDLKEYAHGLDYIQKCLAIAEELQWSERVLDSQCFFARLYRLSGDVENAMVLLEDILKAKDPRGYAFEEYAECLLLSGQMDQARPQFKRAYELLANDPWYPPTETERFERIRGLAGLS